MHDPAIISLVILDWIGIVVVAQEVRAAVMERVVVVRHTQAQDENPIALSYSLTTEFRPDSDRPQKRGMANMRS